MIEEKQVEVFEIDLNKKYVLIFDRKVMDGERYRLAKIIKEWLTMENEPFLYLFDATAKLVKISEDEEDEDATR